ncbi:citrate/2-methylcitrate synthase, partial [Ornithinibacillus scapharcae]|uniref:citrate/2-methylcitrate synthase n=1 Tax=Ornithinibacillus scapharcae TaxID=1147159 RepID=UPI000225B5F6
MFNPGLKGVTAVQTVLSDIDGQQGLLSYRGRSVQTLVDNFSFEEVAYFLLYGTFPKPKIYEEFINELKNYRKLSNYIVNIL